MEMYAREKELDLASFLSEKFSSTNKVTSGVFYKDFGDNMHGAFTSCINCTCYCKSRNSSGRPYLFIFTAVVPVPSISILSEIIYRILYFALGSDMTTTPSVTTRKLISIS